MGPILGHNDVDRQVNHCIGEKSKKFAMVLVDEFWVTLHFRYQMVVSKLCNVTKFCPEY